MCKYGKYLIICLENRKYSYTVSAVFETKKFAENYIELYLKGRKNCSFSIIDVEYFY